MSTETDTSAAGWNVNTLKEFFSTSLNDLKVQLEGLRQADNLRYHDALVAADRAVAKAEAAAEKRFESVNEFRNVLSNQSATLITRTESDAQMQAMSEKIDGLKERMDRNEGADKGVAARMATTIAIATVVATLAGAAVTYINHGTIPLTVGADTKRVDDLVARMDAWQRTAPPVLVPLPATKP